MPRIRPNASRTRRQTYFKEWRKYRHLSQTRLAKEIGASVASVSRIEAGLQPYSQDYLEALAEALLTDPASLLSRGPGDLDVMWSIWDRASDDDKQRIIEIARVITGHPDHH
jgi:transcriptional regulator with XRE-family HTH domain